MTTTKKLGVLFLSFGLAMIFIGVANLVSDKTSSYRMTSHQSDSTFLLITGAILTVAGLTKITENPNSKKKDSTVPIDEDGIVQLERLSKLFQQGIISEEEFIQQKKKILG